MNALLKALLYLLILAGTMPSGMGQSPIPVDLSGLRPGGGATVARERGFLLLTWAASEEETAWCRINLAPGEPLIDELGVGPNGAAAAPIARHLDPFLAVTIGERDAAKAARGMVFFDNPRHRPHETHVASLAKKSVRAWNQGSRTTVTIEELTAGSFRGRLELTVYDRSPLLHAQSVVRTDEKLRAIIYDAGIVTREPTWRETVWMDPRGRILRSEVEPDVAAWPVAVKHRVIVAEGAAGSLAVFPHPHQYFYPLDFANNYKFAWFGQGYGGVAAYGLGIRQPPEGDKRWVPWVDAPAGSEQRLSLFYLLSSKDGPAAIEETARFTRDDRFKKLPGHRTFTSHYHVEHTDEFLRRQREQGTSGVPRGLEAPGFVGKFKQTGVEIVHLGEFHFGSTPRLRADERCRCSGRCTKNARGCRTTKFSSCQAKSRMCTWAGIG